MIYVNSFALNPMNNNITRFMHFNIKQQASKQENIEWESPTKYCHIYTSIFTAAVDALSCLPFRHSPNEVKCSPCHFLHVVESSEWVKERERKGNVFFIQISSYYYSIECISNCRKRIYPCAQTSQRFVFEKWRVKRGECERFIAE